MNISDAINNPNIETVDRATVAHTLIESGCIGTAHVELDLFEGDARRLLALRLDVLDSEPIVSGDFFHVGAAPSHHVTCQTPEFSFRSVTFLKDATDQSRLIVIADVTRNSIAMENPNNADRVLLGSGPID